MVRAGRADPRRPDVVVLATPDGSLAGEILLQVGLVSIPVLIGMAILRYRLYDIDRIVSRTVSYGAVVVVLAAVYVGGVALFTRVLPFEGAIAVAGSTLTTAALFNPLRRSVSRWVDRRFYRSRYDAELVAGEFAHRLRDEVDADTLAADLIQVVVGALRPTTVALWRREEER